MGLAASPFLAHLPIWQFVLGCLLFRYNVNSRMSLACLEICLKSGWLREELVLMTSNLLHSLGSCVA